MKKKYKILAKDTALFTISSFGSKILVFLLTPLYTSILSTTEYGIADLISTTVHFIYPILTLAISDATLRYALDKKENKSDVFCVSTIFIVISTLFVMIFKPAICFFDQSLNEYWKVFVANYILFNVHNYFANFVKGLGLTRLFAMQGLVHTISIIVCNIIFLLWCKWGLIGYLTSTLIGYLIPIFMMFFGAKLYKYIYPFKINKVLLKDMLTYCIPMVPTILAWNINTSIDKYMIIGMHGLSESGVYSVAHKIPTIITSILAVFTQAWQLSVISNHGDEDESEFFSSVYKGLDFVTISGCMFTILICESISSFIFAKDFYIAWTYVPMLVIAAMFSSHSGFLAAAYRAAKKTRSLFFSVMVGAIINIILNYFLIKSIGVIGAAVGTALSFFMVWVVRMIGVQKIVSIRINKFKTSICYIILFVSALLTMESIKCASWIVIGGYVIICILHYETILAIIHGVVSIIRKK